MPIGAWKAPKWSSSWFPSPRANRHEPAGLVGRADNGERTRRDYAGRLGVCTARSRTGTPVPGRPRSVVRLAIGLGDSPLLTADWRLAQARFSPFYPQRARLRVPLMRRDRGNFRNNTKKNTAIQFPTKTFFPKDFLNRLSELSVGQNRY